MAAEILQVTHTQYEDEELGSVMAATRETSRFGEGPLAHSSDYFRGTRKHHVKYVQQAQRQCSIRRLARAQFRTEQRLWFGELPDSALSTLYATSESDSDDFDYGACSDRHDQRNHLFQTSSTDSTQSWSETPNQSWQNRFWEYSQTSWAHREYHVSWWQGSRFLSPQPIFSRCRFGSACSAHGEDKPSVY